MIDSLLREFLLQRSNNNRTVWFNDQLDKIFDKQDWSDRSVVDGRSGGIVYGLSTTEYGHRLHVAYNYKSLIVADFEGRWLKRCRIVPDLFLRHNGSRADKKLKNAFHVVNGFFNYLEEQDQIPARLRAFLISTGPDSAIPVLRWNDEKPHPIGPVTFEVTGDKISFDMSGYPGTVCSAR